MILNTELSNHKPRIHSWETMELIWNIFTVCAQDIQTHNKWIARLLSYCWKYKTQTDKVYGIYFHHRNWQVCIKTWALIGYISIMGLSPQYNNKDKQYNHTVGYQIKSANQNHGAFMYGPISTSTSVVFFTKYYTSPIEFYLVYGTHVYTGPSGERAKRCEISYSQ